MRQKKKFLIGNYEKDLRTVKRWHRFKVMFYRTDLEIHTKRIIAMVEEFLPFILTIYPDLDVYRLLLLIWFHDSPEFITGDVSLQLKLGMSDGQLTELSSKELVAIELLSDSYPIEILGYSIKELMLEAKCKKTVASQLMSFVDKVDGFCEAFHEVLASNNVFIAPVWNYALETFGNLEKKYPLLKELFDSEHFFFKKHIGETIEYFNYGCNGPFPHTKESLTKTTGFPYYEVWKNVTIKHFGHEVLTVQKEFFHMKNA